MLQGPSLSLEGIDHIHGGDGLPPCVLGVGDSVSDHVLEEAPENCPRVVVDEGRDALHASTSGETPDGRLGDAVDGGLGSLPGVPLDADLADTFASFAFASHCGELEMLRRVVVSWGVLNWPVSVAGI